MGNRKKGEPMWQDRRLRLKSPVRP